MNDEERECFEADLQAMPDDELIARHVHTRGYVATVEKMLTEALAKLEMIEAERNRRYKQEQDE